MAILTHISSWPIGTVRVVFCVLIAVAAACVSETSVAIGQEPPPSEDQVKAAFLINFPKYVDWPAEAFADTNSPIVIAVLAETKLIDEINRIITGRSVNGRPLILKRLAFGQEIGVCHILFVSGSEQQRSPKLLAKLKGTILTVGERDDFLASGGIINLARRGQKVGLEVSLSAASNARIQISSKLLNVASVMKGNSK